MPSPVYIIAAESVSEDRETNLVSLFHVLEVITVEVSVVRTPNPTPNESRVEHHVSGKPMVVIAVWMKNPSDDTNAVYEHQFVLRYPDGTEKMLHQLDEVAFPSEAKKLTRHGLKFANFMPKQNGVHRFVSRMRLVAGADWIEQQFPLDCVVSLPKNDPEATQHLIQSGFDIPADAQQPTP